MEVDTGSLKDLPIEGQPVSNDGKTFDTVKEGLAYILTPQTTKVSKKESGSVNQLVFYNPIQQFNRDLSVLAIRAYGEDLQAKRIAHEGKRRRRSQPRSQPAKNVSRSENHVETGLDEARPQNGHRNDIESRGMKRKREETDNSKEAPLSKEVQEEEDVQNENTNVSAVDQSTQNESIRPLGVSNDASNKPVEEASIPLKNGEREKSERDKASKPVFRLSILDALSATGLRALRYAKELPFQISVTANDISPEAAAAIKLNVQHNELGERIHTINENALAHMYDVAFPSQQKKGPRIPKYDVVDLDPYGTAAPFFDASLQAINDNGGLLCVTCTDAGVWASNGYPEKAYALYGGIPTKGNHSHEVGLRLIIHAIATTASRYGLSIEPLLSLSIDFYARIFIRVKKSPVEVKFLAPKTMFLYNCDHGCGAWETQHLARHDTFEAKNGLAAHKFGMAQGPSCSPHCAHCGHKTHISGPMWGGLLHNSAFVEKILAYLPELDANVYKTAQRVEGVLCTVLEETIAGWRGSTDSKKATNEAAVAVHRPVPPMDPEAIDHSPFFFIPSALSKVLHCQAPPEAPLKGALRHAGYKATRSHTRPGSIRTDAPWKFIWDMMREWLQQRNPSTTGLLKENTPGWHIMHGKPDAEGARKEVTDEQSVRLSQNNEREMSPDHTKAKIVFDDRLGKEHVRKRLVRYQVNPQPNWGPQAKASG